MKRPWFKLAADFWTNSKVCDAIDRAGGDVRVAILAQILMAINATSARDGVLLRRDVTERYLVTQVTGVTKGVTWSEVTQWLAILDQSDIIRRNTDGSVTLVGFSDEWRDRGSRSGSTRSNAQRQRDDRDSKKAKEGVAKASAGDTGDRNALPVTEHVTPEVTLPLEKSRGEKRRSTQQHHPSFNSPRTVPESNDDVDDGISPGLESGRGDPPKTEGARSAGPILKPLMSAAAGWGPR